MIFNINENQFKTMKALHPNDLVFVEFDDRIELFLLAGAHIFKTTHLKEGAEQDLIWRENNLKEGIRAISYDKQDISFKLVRE